MRMQDARLVLPAEREHRQRRIQDRHPAKPQGRMRRRAGLVIVVEMHLRRLQIPVSVARLAGREGIREETELILALEIEPLGLAISLGHAAAWRLGRQAVAIRHIEHHRRVRVDRIAARCRGNHRLRWINQARHLTDDLVIDVLG